MEFLLPRGDSYQIETLAHRKQNVDSELICLRNTKPILDTKVYKAVIQVGMDYRYHQTE